MLLTQSVGSSTSVRVAWQQVLMPEVNVRQAQSLRLPLHTVVIAGE